MVSNRVAQTAITIISLLGLWGCVGNVVLAAERSTVKSASDHPVDALPADKQFTASLEQLDRLLDLPDEQIDIGLAALLLEKAVFPEVDIRARLQEIDSMAGQIRSAVSARPTAIEKLALISEYIYRTREFSCGDTVLVNDPARVTAAMLNDNGRYRWLSQLLASGKGNCNSLTVMWLSLGGRLAVPLRGAVAPWHVLVSYDDGTQDGFFIEATVGEMRTADRLAKEFDLKPNRHYLRPLTNKEFIGALLSNHLSIDMSQRRRHAEGLVCLDKALALFPGFPDAWVNRGAVLRSLGRLKEAAESHRQGLKIRPDDYTAWFNLGNVLIDLGEYEEAISGYEHALSLNPDYAACKKAIARNRWKVGMKPVARSAYGRVLAVNSNTIRIDDARTLIQEGRPYEAAAMLDSVLEMSPDSVRALAAKASILAKAGKYEDAQFLYEKALKHEPGYILCQMNMALTLLRMGKREQALRHLEEAVELSPNNTRALHLRSDTLRELGRYRDALECADMGLALDQRNVGLWGMKAKAHIALNETEEAKQCAEKIRSIRDAAGL